MRNKVIIYKSRCAEYFSGKSRFMKQSQNKKVGTAKIVVSNIRKQTC